MLIDAKIARLITGKAKKDFKLSAKMYCDSFYFEERVRSAAESGNYFMKINLNFDKNNLIIDGYTIDYNEFIKILESRGFKTSRVMYYLIISWELG